MKLQSLIATLRSYDVAQRPGRTSPLAAVVRVEVRDEQGHCGIGEALPMGDLSGESAQSALDFIDRLQTQWLQSIGDMASLAQWSARHAQPIDWNPAAWTAVELALLDLMARRDGVQVEHLLGLPPPAPPPRGTALIAEASPGQFDGQLTYFICAGYRDYKIPLSGDLQVDRSRIDALEAGRISGAQVRADAHRLWLSAEQADDYLWQLGFPWWAVEEPLAPGALREMRQLAQRRGIRIVLDDSLCRADQLDELAQDAQRWVAVVRVAKMGGLLRALRFVDRARALGIEMILASHADDPPSQLRAQLCIGARAGTLLLAREGGAGEPDFHAPGRESWAEETQCAERLSGWLRQPGLGVDYGV